MVHRPHVSPALEVHGKNRPTRLFGLDRDVVRIGRDSSSELVIDDQRVSRSHAQIVRQPDGFYVEDLASHNLTYLDDLPLTPNSLAPLRDGSRITICDHQLIFRRAAIVIGGESSAEAAVLKTLDEPGTWSGDTRLDRPDDVLRAVLEIHRALGGEGELNEGLNRTLKALFDIFRQAECGFILTEEADGQLNPRAIRRRDGETSPPALSRTVLEHVMNAGKALLIANVQAEPVFRATESLAGSGIRTALCVPLPGRAGRPIGILQLDSRSRLTRFGPADLDLLAAAAIPIGMAIENYRLFKARAEASAARQIQLALLPRHRPEIAGYSLWEHYEPALEVGGDYYDYIPLASSGEGSQGRWAIAVGDVAGLNHHFLEAELRDLFITLLLAVIDPATHRLTVVRAGHPGPLLRRARGSVEVIGESDRGMPLAVVGDQEYKAATVELEPGDMVVLYTDGINEALDRNANLFGIASLVAALESASPGAAAAGAAILDAVRTHVGNRTRSDDMTLICFGRDSDH